MKWGRFFRGPDQRVAHTDRVRDGRSPPEREATLEEAAALVDAGLMPASQFHELFPGRSLPANEHARPGCARTLRLVRSH